MDWNEFEKNNHNWNISAISQILKNKLTLDEESKIEQLLDSMIKNGMDEHTASHMIQTMIDIGARNERNEKDLNL